MKLKFFVAPVLLAVAVLCHNYAAAQQKTETQKNESRTSLSVNSFSSDGSNETNIDYVEEGHRYKIRLNGSKIAEMYVDGKKLSEEEFAKYEPMVKKIMIQVEKDREQAQKDREQAERDREQAAKDRVQAEKDRQQAERDREQANRDREQANKDREQAERDRQNSKESRSNVEKDRAQAELDRKQAQKDRDQAALDRKQAEKDREQAARDRVQAEKDRAQAEEDRKLLFAMIDELVSEKLIESRDALTSLELDATSLLVNGKEVPATIHSRFKDKYLKNKNGRISYRNSGGTRNMSFN